MPIRGKTNKQKLSTNLTLYEAYINHWPKLRRAETKRKKEFNLGTWEKETSNTISLKKNEKSRVASSHFLMCTPQLDHSEMFTELYREEKKEEGDRGGQEDKRGE